MAGQDMVSIVEHFTEAANSPEQNYSKVYDDILGLQQQAAGNPRRLEELLKEANTHLLAAGLLPDVNLDRVPDIIMVGAGRGGHILTAQPETGTLQLRDSHFNVVVEKSGDGHVSVEPRRPASAVAGDGLEEAGKIVSVKSAESVQPQATDAAAQPRVRSEQWGNREFTVNGDGTAEYVVKSGDTVWSVATDVLRNRLGHEPSSGAIAGEVQRIAEASGLNKPPRTPDLIYPEDKLIVPAFDGQAPAPQLATVEIAPPAPETRRRHSEVSSGATSQPLLESPLPVDQAPPPAEPRREQQRSSHSDRQNWYISQQGDGRNGSQWFACGPTSLLMALADFGLATADEPTRQKLIDETGTRRAGQFPGNAELIGRYARQYGLNAEYNGSNDWRQVDAAINEGKGAIVNGSLRSRSGGTVGHFVYIAGKDEQGRYILGDPANPATSRWTAEELRAFMTRGSNPPGFAAVWRG